MTFVQQRNRLTTHFSERIPVVKRRISVLARPKRIILVKHCKPATLRTIHPATGGHIPEGRSTPLSACSDTKWDATSYYSHSRNETDAATHERTPSSTGSLKRYHHITPHQTQSQRIWLLTNRIALSWSLVLQIGHDTSLPISSRAIFMFFLNFIISTNRPPT